MSKRTNRITYIAAAGADQVVFAGQAILEAIIIGKDVEGGIVEVSDHASDGDGNVKIYLADPVPGFYEVCAMFEHGICADLTTQTNVSFVWRPA
jgi:hypothetical protein